MRIAALAILTAGTVLTATPAPAQTFSGNYPFCLQHFRWGGADNPDCSYASLAQCQATSVGWAALCQPNPYFAHAQAPAGPRHRRQRSGY